MPRALLVDDHSDTLSALTELVRGEGFETQAVVSLDEARTAIAEHVPDVILLDLQLPDGDGMALLDTLDPSSSPAIIFITGHASLDSAVEALRRGVSDYLVKPIDVARLKSLLAEVSQIRGLKREIGELRDSLDVAGRFAHLVGASEPMRSLYDQISRVSPTNATVLVTGESGTGKELAARSIHDLSRRRGATFLPVNCGAISPTLMESELFGHERGSFTGADRQHKGLFERASRGTIFLDEITEMPIELQVKLLRVLETGSLSRVGGETLRSVDVRVVAATNRDPMRAVEDGKLREDLYYRLKVFQLSLPSLRERTEDIELLTTHFLAELVSLEGAVKQFDREAIEVLRAYGWPGNVRELRNVVYSAYILANEIIDVACLPPEVSRRRESAVFDGSSVTLPVGTSLEEAERRFILATLSHVEGNRNRTAELLGISVKTLYNRLRQYRAGPPTSGRTVSR